MHGSCRPHSTSTSDRSCGTRSFQRFRDSETVINVVQQEQVQQDNGEEAVEVACSVLPSPFRLQWSGSATRDTHAVANI